VTTTLTDDYSGPFDPDWSLERLTRKALARLVRENMLLSMIHNQSLIPHLAVLGGRPATIAIADCEWMGASPIYTARNKASLGFHGDGVAEIFKSFQFDIGAPHHYLDFRFEVVDHDHGYFWLAHCGAYKYVRLATDDDRQSIHDMCHEMEDRTFDATLAVNNPGARATPIHRPPEPVEGDDGAACRWEVRIAPGRDQRPDHPILGLLRTTRAARFPFQLGDSREPGGLEDYSGEFRPFLRLEDFCHAVLVRQVKETLLDVHLLMRSGYAHIDQRYGPEVLDDLAVQDRAAMMPMAVQRLRQALNIRGDDIEAIAKLLQVHPLLPPHYVRLGVAVDGSSSGRIWVVACDGLDDDATRSPLSWLREPDRPTFDSLVWTVNPQAVVESIDVSEVPEADAVVAWRFRIDPDAVAPELPWTAGMIGIDGMASFDLGERTGAPVTIRGSLSATSASETSRAGEAR
jgi:hypothetical protein